MSSKLYTEEEVIKAIAKARVLKNWMDLEFEFNGDEIIDKLIPIELPSDVEIKEFAQNLCNGNQHLLNCCLIMGKMVIQKIKSKNVQ